MLYSVINTTKAVSGSCSVRNWIVCGKTKQPCSCQFTDTKCIHCVSSSNHKMSLLYNSFAFWSHKLSITEGKPYCIVHLHKDMHSTVYFCVIIYADVYLKKRNSKYNNVGNHCIKRMRYIIIFINTDIYKVYRKNNIFRKNCNRFKLLAEFNRLGNWSVFKVFRIIQLCLVHVYLVPFPLSTESECF